MLDHVAGTCGAVVTTVLRKPWLRAVCRMLPNMLAAAGSPAR